MNPQLNLRHLRYFCAAFEARSALGAARLCHVSQPAISGAIAQLEAELGQRLFLRQQRGLAATPAAQRLYPLAQKLLADARAIGASFRPGGQRPALALQVLPSLSLERLRALFALLREEIEHLALNLVAPGQPADAWLSSRACAPPGLDFVPLWEERYALVVPAAHPLAVQPQLGLQDLDQVDFIERSHCELAAAWRQALGQQSVQPQVRAWAQSEEWALGLVAAGIGVTIAPVHAAQAQAGVVVRRDVPALQAHKREIGWAYQAPAAGVLAQALAACRAGPGLLSPLAAA
ncbi:LysR family transcriptional regulator [Roseateles violae]|uniref:LysR family transcriptional regulator n=1 Tax=Roseateles violae TaxID=3058042 RepID=A0ABT8DQ50_9BURK|nr:LysR family transcriptional regulator [Pelomonas sp. PFR6]MDN3919069.1 LysR family transcriptional regulator [Pelomonas sp. PFR6]